MLTKVPQLMSQSSSATVLALTSRLPAARGAMQVLPTVHVASQISAPRTSCELPQLLPVDAAVQCAVCGDGQQVVVARSSSSDSVYFRVVFYGRSCGPWLLVAPPTAPALSDNRVRRNVIENALRITSAEYSALVLLPAPGPVSSSSIADHRSFRSTQAIRFQSLSAAAAALVDYPSASSFFISHTPLVSDEGKPVSSQAFRSRLVVETIQPPLAPARVAWRVSSNVAVVSDSELLFQSGLLVSHGLQAPTDLHRSCC